MSAQKHYKWVVINQSQSPMFQQMIARLAEQFGPCLLLTGTPFPLDDSSLLDVRQGPAYARASLKGRLASWLKFDAWASYQLARLPAPAFVFAVSNPPMNAQLGWVLHRLRKSRVALLIWDVYPDHVVQMGWLSATNPVVRAWRKLNQWAIRDSDAVVTLGPSMAQKIAAYVTDEDVPVHIIPNWADTDTFHPRERDTNPFVRAHGLQDKFCVMYSGNMGGSHDMETIVRSAEKLRERRDIGFVLVGEGMGREVVEQVCEQENLDNVLLLPYQPWETLPDSLAAGHVGIVSQARESHDLSVPSKTYSLLASGVPVVAITTTTSDLGCLITEHQAGAVSAPGDPEQLAQLLAGLADDRATVHRMAEAARDAALTHFNEDAVYAQFVDVFSAIPGMEGNQ